MIAVPMKDPTAGPVEMTLLRIINDSRAANIRQADSTHMPIASLPAFQQVVSNVIRHVQGLPFYIINADVRHCFFQYPLPPSIASMFACKSRHDGSYYVPNAMQMGSALSPIIAQTGTWAMLLNNKFRTAAWSRHQPHQGFGAAAGMD